MTETIIIAILGSGALSALIAGIFQLINNRREKNDKRFKRLEKDIIRLNLMVMLKMFPEERTDILRLGEYYFEELKGNWVLTSAFNHWLLSNNIAKPEWFKGGDHDEVS